MLDRRLKKQAEVIFNDAVEAMMQALRPQEDLSNRANGTARNDARVVRAEQLLCSDSEQTERPVESMHQEQDECDHDSFSDEHMLLRPMRIETSHLEQCNIDGCRFGSAIILCNLASMHLKLHFVEHTFRNDIMEKALLLYQMAHTILSDLLFGSNEEGVLNATLDWEDKRLILFVVATNNIIRINEDIGRHSEAWGYVCLLVNIGIVVHGEEGCLSFLENYLAAPAA